MRPEAIGPVLGARAARARRACERWAEDNDARGAPLEVLQDAAVALAEERGKDLDEAAVAKVCRETVASWVDGTEQREAEEAIASARREREAVEQEARARYSAECAAAWRRGRPTPDPPRSQPVFSLDDAGKREAARAMVWSTRRREEPER